MSRFRFRRVNTHLRKLRRLNQKVRRWSDQMLFMLAASQVVDDFRAAFPHPWTKKVEGRRLVHLRRAARRLRRNKLPGKKGLR